MKEKEEYMVSIYRRFESNIYSMVLASAVKLYGGWGHRNDVIHGDEADHVH